MMAKIGLMLPRTQSTMVQLTSTPRRTKMGSRAAKSVLISVVSSRPRETSTNMVLPKSNVMIEAKAIDLRLVTDRLLRAKDGTAKITADKDKGIRAGPAKAMVRKDRKVRNGVDRYMAVSRRAAKDQEVQDQLVQGFRVVLRVVVLATVATFVFGSSRPGDVNCPLSRPLLYLITMKQAAQNISFANMDVNARNSCAVTLARLALKRPH